MRFLSLAAFAMLGLVTACSTAVLGTGTATDDVTSEVALKGESKMFPGFAYDTGLQPASSPAQVSLAFKTEGALHVTASGARRDGGKLEGKAGSGKLAIDLHAKLAGKLKVDSTFKKYDGEIPGLDKIDVAAVAEAPFDPFLLEEGQQVETVANVPETKLPSIPLGGVPGSLELTVKTGSIVRAKLHGTCLRGASGAATFQGETVTSGKLVIGAVMKLDLPKPLDKEVALPDIVLDLPEAKGTLDAASESAVAGIGDFEAGACAASSPKDPPSSSSSSSSGGTGTKVPGSSGSSGTVGGTNVTVTIDNVVQPLNAGYATVQDHKLVVNLREHGTQQAPPYVQLYIERPGDGCEKMVIDEINETYEMHQSLDYQTGEGTWMSAQNSLCGLSITHADFTVGGRLAGTFDGPITLVSEALPGMKKTMRMKLAFDVEIVPVN